MIHNCFIINHTLMIYDHFITRMTFSVNPVVWWISLQLAFCKDFIKFLVPKKGIIKNIHVIVRSKWTSIFVWATFSKTHKWWLGQVSRLFLLACPLYSRDIFLAAGPRRGEKIQQEFGPSKPVFLLARLFCTQQILSLWIKAVCVEVREGRDGGC